MARSSQDPFKAVGITGDTIRLLTSPDLHDETHERELSEGSDEFSDEGSDYGNCEGHVFILRRVYPHNFYHSSEEKRRSPSGKEDENGFWCGAREAVFCQRLQTKEKSQPSPRRAAGRPFRGKKNGSIHGDPPALTTARIHQVFSHLSPKDIIHLSRTSRIFRNTLMMKISIFVWKAARERIGAPECPSNMSEPQWAVLLFGNLCQVGKKNPVFTVAQYLPWV